MKVDGYDIDPVTGTRSMAVTGATGGGGGTGDASASNQTLQIAQETAINTVLGTTADAAAASDTATATHVSLFKRLLQRIATLITQLPASLGAKTSAASLSVTLASDQAAVPVSGTVTANIGTIGTAATAANQTTELARVGDLTEAAPASDTASAGLNGRLQRIAQRLTALIAQLPASLGAKTGAASLSVVPASDSPWLTDTQLRATAVPVSGTVTANIGTGGTLATAANQSTELTRLGDVVEAAPASDTASSGLNGRLQRIAQRLTSLIAQLPASLGAQVGSASLSVVPASDVPWLTDTQLRASAVPVLATSGQVAVIGEVTITRPAGALTYTAGNALYNSAVASTAPTVSFTVVSSGAAVTAGSVLVITGVQLHAATATPTVLPLVDLLLSPTTFTALADNAAWAPTLATLRDGYVLATTDGLLAGASGALAWNYDAAAQIKLAVGQSQLWLQPRFRLAYASSGGEAFKFRLTGYLVQ